MKLYERYLSLLREDSIHNNSDISLAPWDKTYYNNLPDDKHEVNISSRNSKRFIILSKSRNIPIGFAGVWINSNPDLKHFGFFQIYIEKKFRGQNLLCPIAKLIHDTFKFKFMLSTVKLSNKASLLSHMRAECFKKIDKNREDYLIANKYMSKDETRFIYKKK